MSLSSVSGQNLPTHPIVLRVRHFRGLVSVLSLVSEPEAVSTFMVASMETSHLS